MRGRLLGLARDAVKPHTSWPTWARRIHPTSYSPKLRRSRQPLTIPLPSAFPRKIQVARRAGRQSSHRSRPSRRSTRCTTGDRPARIIDALCSKPHVGRRNSRQRSPRPGSRTPGVKWCPIFNCAPGSNKIWRRSRKRRAKKRERRVSPASALSCRSGTATRATTRAAEAQLEQARQEITRTQLSLRQRARDAGTELSVCQR